MGRPSITDCSGGGFRRALPRLGRAQFWPSLEFTQLSVRANVDYAFVSGGFPVSDTWQVLVPGVLTIYSPLFVGIVGLGLALLAGDRSRWRAVCSVILLAQSGPLAAPRCACLCHLFRRLGLLALLVSYGDGAFSILSFTAGCPAGSYFAARNARLIWSPLA